MVIKNAERFPGELLAVSKAFKVTRGLESLVEQLLGHDLAALTVEDPASARRIVSALADEGVRGEMALIMRDDEAAMHQAAHVYEGDGGGHPLLEDITYPEQLRPVVEALLGDVVVCKDRESAFEVLLKESETLVENGVSGKTSSTSKTSSTNYGTLKPDETTITAVDGVLSVVESSIVANENVGLLKVDGTTITSDNGVLSININNISKASSTTYGTIMFDESQFSISDDGTLNAATISELSYLFLIK